MALVHFHSIHSNSHHLNDVQSILDRQFSGAFLFILHFFLLRNKILSFFYFSRSRALIMFSSDCTNNYSTSGAIVPCSSILSKTNNNCNSYQPANCYRPLQQLYKTVYSPLYESNAPTMNIACICRPAERYKTTNMTYGSFYYDNSLSMDKNRVINYDKAAFARCYDNTRDRLGYHSKNSNRRRE